MSPTQNDVRFMRTALTEAAKRFQARRNQTKVFPAHDAYNRIAPELLPPALGLTVIHHEIRISELARRTEIENEIVREEGSK